MRSEDVQARIDRFTEAVDAENFNLAERELGRLLEVIAATEIEKTTGVDFTEDILATLRSGAPQAAVGKFTTMAMLFTD
jgi:hypothetical protein